MIGRAIAAALALVVAALVIGWFWGNHRFRTWLAGVEFQNLVESLAGGALGGTAQVDPISWSGPSAFSPKFSHAGGGRSKLRALEAQQVRAEVNWREAFSGTWHVRSIDVARIEAEIGDAKPGEDIPSPVVAPTTAAKIGLPTWIAAFLPRGFQLDEVRSPDANVGIDSVGTVRGARLSMRPEGSGWILDLNGGRFEPSAVLPRLDLESVRIRLQQGDAHLTEAVLRTGEAGVIRASGELGGNSKQADIRINWERLDVRDLLDTAWQDRLSGRLAGSARIQPKGRESGIDGQFVLTDGLLTGLAIQDQIAKFTRSPQFARMPVHEWSAEFKMLPGGSVQLDNLVLESKGLLRMTGQCRVGSDNELEGTFRIGVTPQTLQWIPGSQDRVFVESKDGYLWTDLSVGGTIDQPTEDLSARLATAMGEQIIESGIDILRTAPANPREAVDKAIDLLNPFLRP